MEDIGEVFGYGALSTAGRAGHEPDVVSLGCHGVAGIGSTRTSAVGKSWGGESTKLCRWRNALAAGWDASRRWGLLPVDRHGSIVGEHVDERILRSYRRDYRRLYGNGPTRQAQDSLCSHRSWQGEAFSAQTDEVLKQRRGRSKAWSVWDIQSVRPELLLPAREEGGGRPWTYVDCEVTGGTGSV